MRETQRSVTARDGVPLSVTVYEADENAGDQPVRDVLLLHGWPNAARVWQSLAGALLLSPGLRLIAPNFRGFGDSGRPDEGYTCARFADDVEDVTAGLSLAGYVLVGHSMGGKIAQLVAARRPEALAGLALVAPVPLVAAPVPEEKKAAQRAAFGDANKTRALLSAMAAHPLDEVTLTLLVEDGLRTSQAAWNGWLDPMREEDFTEEAGKIGVPALVIGGRKDPLRSEDLLRRDIVERIAHAEYAGVPHTGHLVHLEEPEALAALLVNFLDRLPPR